MGAMGAMGALGAMGVRIAAIALLLVVCPAVAAAQKPLERARAFYNAGNLDDAIAAAAVAKNKPSTVPSATLIGARAQLERFRRTNEPTDLAAARADLASLNPHQLSPQEIIEWQIGLGTTLFLDNQPGPAAEMFSTVLPSARGRVPAPEFEKLLEWWASALSRVAESHDGPARKEAYGTMLAAVRAELERDPLSRPIAYWLVVAARGAGDLEGAYNVAVTSWIRAGSQADGKQLRSDLDRFVTQTLIPERAQARTGHRLDTKTALADIATLTEEWRAIGQLWQSVAP
jgi:HAMP domain-containing protein